jgi:CHASE2 domain-containing sensor protein
MDMSTHKLHKNPSQGRFAEWISHLLKIVFVTLWLAGALLWAEHHGWLDGLDNLMFAHAVDVIHDEAPALQADRSTLIVKISRSYYETEFHERSPLDPRVLDQIIQVITTSRPSQLAIDLDLSPSPSDMDLVGAVTAREAMADKLKLLATHGGRVLIVLPGVTSTPAEQVRKAEWAGALCQAGIELADPNLGLSHTPVGISLLKYVDELPSLGVLMAPEPPSGLCASRNEDGKIPTLMLAPNTAAASLMNATESGERKRINFKGFEEPDIFPLVTRQDIDKLAHLLASSKWKTIVLAGNYSEADLFQLPNGRTVSGAEVHAAVAYSIQHPVKPNHVLAFLMDLAIGVLVGLALHKLWHGYKDTPFLYVKALCLFGAVTVFTIPIIGLLFTMPELLARNMWINAIPLLIGLFIHGIMEPLHTEHHSEQHDSPAYPWSVTLLLAGLKKSVFVMPHVSVIERGAEIGSKLLWIAFRCGFVVYGLFMVTASMFHH